MKVRIKFNVIVDAVIEVAEESENAVIKAQQENIKILADTDITDIKECLSDFLNADKEEIKIENESFEIVE